MMRRLFLLVFVLVLGPTVASATETSADSKYVDSAEYDLPSYTNTKLPPITSCDPKEEASLEIETGSAMGNAAVSGAKTLFKELSAKKKTDEAGDPDDVDASVSIDSKCREPARLNIDEKIAEKATCSDLKGDAFIESIRKQNEDARKALACQRGVLAAINGELTCFRKQITATQAYMNELINNPGGLASMLTTGVQQMGEIDKEVGDRSAQLKELSRRLEDPKNGMGAAKEKLTELANDIPNKQASLENDIQDVRAQQSRFETLVKEITMGKAMECLSKPTAGYRCVKSGSTSARYAMGDVSPLDYMKCIYGQSANRLVGSSIVKNDALETSRNAQAESAIKNLSVSKLTTMPAFTDQKGFEGTMGSYEITTPQQLIAALSGVTGAADKATGKAVSQQLANDVNRCYASATKQISVDRANSNTNIGVNSQKVLQFAKTKGAGYASEMRKLSSIYEQAVKSATGKSLQLNTSQCERTTLEGQGSCLKAMGAMVKAVLTGDGAEAAAALSAPPGNTLTSGQPPIDGFMSDLKAPSDTKDTPAAQRRTISNIACRGLQDCVAKYENLKVELETAVEERKQKKESMKSDINQRISQTAQSIASGKDPKTGAVTNSMSLNQVSQALDSRRAALVAAMNRLKVAGGLDLEPEKLDGTDIDEKTGLYSAKDLKSLVLGAITPPIPGNDNKGFQDASKDLHKRDDELEEKQDKLDAYIERLKSRQAECATTTSTKACEKATKVLEECRKTAEMDSVYIFCKGLQDSITHVSNNLGTGVDDAKAQASIDAKQAKFESKCMNTGAACGVDMESMKSYCNNADGDAISNNSEKDLNNLGNRNKRIFKTGGVGN